jgi:hypothetical protein
MNSCLSLIHTSSFVFCDTISLCYRLAHLSTHFESWPSPPQSYERASISYTWMGSTDTYSLIFSVMLTILAVVMTDEITFTYAYGGQSPQPFFLSGCCKPDYGGGSGARTSGSSGRKGQTKLPPQSGGYRPLSSCPEVTPKFLG